MRVLRQRQGLEQAEIPLQRQAARPALHPLLRPVHPAAAGASAPRPEGAIGTSWQGAARVSGLGPQRERDPRAGEGIGDRVGSIRKRTAQAWEVTNG